MITAVPSPPLRGVVLMLVNMKIFSTIMIRFSTFFPISAPFKCCFVDNLPYSSKCPYSVSMKGPFREHAWLMLLYLLIKHEITRVVFSEVSQLLFPCESTISPKKLSLNFCSKCSAGCPSLEGSIYKENKHVVPNKHPK